MRHSLVLVREAAARRSSRSLNRWMLAATLFAVGMSGMAFVPTVHAQTAVVAEDDSVQAVARVNRFLDRASTARHVLGFVHFGAGYVGHAYEGTRSVVGADGQPVAGEFAVVYRYDWQDGGQTTIAFLCNRSGTISSVRVLKTNACFNAPFALADAAVQLLGEAVFEAFKTQLNDEQRAFVRQLVDRADSKRLLEFTLQLGQAFDGN
ncbi:MAG: hypothetical protein QM770_01405 [Tepidisphaeraceae bacterium]